MVVAHLAIRVAAAVRHPDAAARLHDGIEGRRHAAGRLGAADLVAVVEVQIRLAGGGPRKVSGGLNARHLDCTLGLKPLGSTRRLANPGSAETARPGYVRDPAPALLQGEDRSARPSAGRGVRNSARPPESRAHPG